MGTRQTRPDLATAFEKIVEQNLPKLPGLLRRVARKDPAKARELAARCAQLGIALKLPH